MSNEPGTTVGLILDNPVDLDEEAATYHVQTPHAIRHYCPI